MACNSITLANIGKECRNATGGLKDIWIIEHDDVTNVTVDATTEKITAIALASSKTFKHWQFNAETGSMTSTGNINAQNGTYYVQTDLALQFQKMESVKRLQITAATAGETSVIVRDQNGVLFYLGYDNPVMASAVSGASGTAMGDLNGYTITLTDLSAGLPMEIEMTTTDLAAIGVTL